MIGPRWKQSARCGTSSCVQVMEDPVTKNVYVRDGKNPHGGILVFTPVDWSAFLGAARAGEFDLDALRPMPGAAVGAVRPAVEVDAVAEEQAFGVDDGQI